MFGADTPSGSAPPVPGPGSRPKSLLLLENSGSGTYISHCPDSLVFDDMRIRIPIRNHILRWAHISKSVFGKTITWPALSRPPDLRPPVDVDHELGEDLRGRVIQPEPAPDRGEVGDGIHHLQHPAWGLPILAEGLQLSVVQAANTNVMGGILSVCIVQGKCRVVACFPLANSKDDRSASLRSYDI